MMVMLAAGWTTDRRPPLPDACSATNIKHHMKVKLGVYTRFCGPASVVVRVNGKSFTIRAGHCSIDRVFPGPYGHTRWFDFGLIDMSGSRTTSNSKGFSLVINPGDRAGRAEVIDGIIQLTGKDLAARGTATLTKGAKGGTFSVVGLGVPQPQRFTGSWSCG
jgi:hypothetical protein